MAEYDDIAEDYIEFNTRITKEYCITPSFLKYLGNIRGKTVLDVGCGDGYYTRMIKNLGASKVVGVDISREMIKIAKEKEQKNPLDIEYFIMDALKMEKIGEFDIVTATFLLHYSKSKEELNKICENISKNLKSGGKLLAINDNPKFIYPKSDKYFVLHGVSKDLKEGDVIKISLLNEDKTINFSFNTYRWNKETYIKILEKVGFKKISWKNPFISLEGKEKFGEDFWKDYITPPTIVFIEAFK